MDVIVIINESSNQNHRGEGGYKYIDGQYCFFSEILY